MSTSSSAEREAPRSSLGLVVPKFRTSAALGILGGWSFIVLILVVTLSVGRSRLSGVWELQSGILGLGPAWLLIVVLPAMIGGLLALVLLKALSGQTVRTVWSCAGLSFSFFTLLGWGLGGGRHLSTLAARGGFAFTLGCSLAVATLFLIPRLLAFLRASSGVRRFRFVAFGAVVGAFFLEAANTFVLVRLYPTLHLALTFLSLFLFGVAAVFAVVRRKALDTGPAVSGFYSHRDPPPSGPSVLIVGTVCALAILLVTPSSRAVAGFDNFRWIIQEGPPTLALGVDFASLVAPPPILAPDAGDTPLGARRRSGSLDLKDRNILLISIDALRADHLGTYGYGRHTTKFIDELAGEGIVFEAAYAPTPHTSYSLTSVMTGKYMRPLLLQGTGGDSDLWATLLRSYDYRTAAFYPPAVFYIDGPRFESFRAQAFGFEYSKVEFAEGDLRVSQVKKYLEESDPARHIFLWVHLFGPHEPYEKHEKYSFGERDIDLYDGEIAVADETVGRLVALARQRDPHTLVILTADHGEEFGDHGGRYHGTSVYDEQVRVPLIFAGEGLAHGRRIREPVQTIDLLPTVLEGLNIPIPPRIRGRSLARHLEKWPNGTEPVDDGKGMALSETDDYTMLAEESFRLICQKRSGACQLFDIDKDPGQKRDISKKQPEAVERLRVQARKLAESHGKYESQGLRAEGKGWPAAILLAISGDASAAPVLATLLDDADTQIRRKSAELLFYLGSESQASALRLALMREEDERARAWLALALTRLGQGAPLVVEILNGPDKEMSRLAALALAEQGNDIGEKVLLRWWAETKELELDLAKRILSAFARLKSKDALGLLIRSLKHERLRPEIARTLADIGDKDARPYLVQYLSKEHYQSARLPLANAILRLGGDEDLIVPLRLFLGVPDGMPGGLGLAREAKIATDLGGPDELERRRLAQLSDSGVDMTLVIPPAPKSSKGVRLIVRCRSRSGASGEVLVQPGVSRVPLKKGEVRSRYQPSISAGEALKLQLPAREPSQGGGAFVEIMADLPARFRAKAGHHLALEVFAPQDIEITDIAAVPLRNDLPPPPKEKWVAPDKHQD